MEKVKYTQLQLPFAEPEFNVSYRSDIHLNLLGNPNSFTFKEIMEILGNPMKVKEWDRRKCTILNKHLLSANHPVEGPFELPKLRPYQGAVPNIFLPYSAKIPKDSYKYGVHCHQDDWSFASSWKKPIMGLNRIIRYKVAIGPDYSLFVDGKKCENIEQLRRNRTISSFWQHFVPTIQSASWGDADSILTYAFDGLAEESWTSISHAAIGNNQEKRLFEFAIKTLVEKKRPIGLLVFGFPLHFDPGVPVKVFPCRINFLRSLKRR